jgi:hypothetical protein
MPHLVIYQMLMWRWSYNNFIWKQSKNELYHKSRRRISYLKQHLYELHVFTQSLSRYRSVGATDRWRISYLKSKSDQQHLYESHVFTQSLSTYRSVGAFVNTVKLIFRFGCIYSLKPIGIRVFARCKRTYRIIYEYTLERHGKNNQELSRIL